MILQVAFISCTGTLIMTSCLHSIKLKLNACSSAQSKLIGRAIQLSYSLRLKIAAHIWKYAEIASEDITHTPSLGLQVAMGP